ncbi:hypothetical protein COY33_01940 [candidate division WWE3 bacterium CG_4_10_14_0_2_um_filter_42_7]|uniref:Transglutaminase-like domain-containing protein n=2 Tax=Katanobacteria TaxID=422282 RepID=A0A2H0X9W5_UNCKA|nr:MAG: hypothetical protein COV11_01370 [Candidatus Woesearchaeota archaeon CG10_big_fil_rev_8_21_14_0_10_30_7]PIS21724.1 MAG: hypothetical protein COT51_01230 [candidate division WWE3 bacterium CG08_land_8_20_14_0_20_41_15]PIZ43194.1 MAG: hypothetical protein COY33_01940 [candidate division WWE3 bacterium CG_4_10_14_0_2_um_filter_42_7]
MQEEASDHYEKLVPENSETYFNESFFQEVWPKLLCTEEAGVNLTGVENPQKRAEEIYTGLVPSLDTYIEKYLIPTSKEAAETDEAFFTRVCSAMFTLNFKNRASKGWQDCWPATAIEVGRTNCTLGSLVLARALENAGYSRNEMEFGMPGPISHAVVIAKSKYIDQANSVVVDVTRSADIDGIRTYRVVESDDVTTMEKIPFRRIPVCAVEQGVAPLIWNLSSMINRNDGSAKVLTERLGLDKSRSYADWARDNLLSKNWENKRMENQPEWVKEKQEVAVRFKQ